MAIKIVVGDCRDALETFAPASIHCVVTSPPYWGLRDYGIPPSVWGGEWDCVHEWGEEMIARQRGDVGDHSTLDGGPQSGGSDRLQEVGQGQFCQKCGAWLGCLGLEPTPELFAEHLVQIFRQVRRVLRDDGTVWLNLGDSYAGSWGNYGARAGNQRSRIAERWHRPAYEDDRYGWNKLPPTANVAGLKPKDLIGIPWRVALALQADGWYLRSAIIWHKPNCMPESVKDRPTNDYEFVFLLAKSERYFYDGEAIKEPAKYGDDIRETKTFGKSSNKDRNDQGRWFQGSNGRNKRTVWTIPTHPFSEAHFATFPPALVEPCIKAGTSERGCCLVCGAPWERVTERTFEGNYNEKEGAAQSLRCTGVISGGTEKVTLGRTEQVSTHLIGWQPTCDCDAGDPVPATVLDPFGGAGTVGLAADRLGRDAVLIEIKPEYAEMARRRIEKDAPMFVDVEIEAHK